MLKAVTAIIVLIAVISAATWLELRGPDIAYETLERKYGTDASHFRDLPDGFHVHFEDHGERSQPVVVLLHGIGDSFLSWEAWVRALTPEYRVITVDFPGHGLTRAPVGYELRTDTLADFVDEFAAALGLDKFAVGGNSLGGGAAWQLAVRHPDRVNALILVDAAGFPNARPPIEVPLAFQILRYPIGRALLRNIDPRPWVEEGLKTDVFDKSLVTAALVDRWAELQRAPGHRAILLAADVRAQTQATIESLGAIRVPTLILHGDSDVLIEPANARKFAAAIPGAKLIIYAQVGHLPQLEIPQRSARDVADFLDAARLVR